MKKTTLFFCLFLSVQLIYAQSIVGKQDAVIAGYQEKVAGAEIFYDSGIPGFNNALIARASDGTQSMVWKTQPAAFSKGEKHVLFVHYIGFDAGNTGTPFDFFVNGRKLGQIKIPAIDQKDWSVDLDKGQQLFFRHAFTDSNKDFFGFLIYKVSVEELKKGEQLQLELKGGKNNEQTWMMVFKERLQESVTAFSLPAHVKSSSGPKQTIFLSFLHLRQPSSAKVFIDKKLVKETDLGFGFYTLDLQYPTVKKEKTIKIRLLSNEIDETSELVLKPIRKWDINFVQHSHTDIGYTRSQTEILAEHLRYIDYALDYCDATDDYPEESKFRWTCEASWAVDEYLNARPKEQIDRLKKRIEEGRIEVTGMYFNFNELPDEQSLAASLLPLKNIIEKGIPVTSAMQNDVNGIGWCMNDYFNSIDVMYLNMGTHGHKALVAFDTPLAFWWLSPSGKRMLAFRAEHYMIGNTAFGIHLKDFPNFEKKVLRYLEDIAKRGYPYDMIAIQHSGFLTDNSPPSLLASDMIRQWNEKYEWPKVSTSVVSTFFEELEKKHGSELIEIKAHWPDWWTDGFASGAREVAASRNAHVDLIAGQGGLAMAKLLGAQMPNGLDARIFEANKALLFYDEHTFGAAESIYDPYGKGTMEQRAIKESYAWEAFRRARMIDEEALGVLNTYISKEEVPSLVVYNTLSWKRDGMLTLFIDHQQVPVGNEIVLKDEAGNSYPAQAVKHWHGGTYWALWVKNIPAFGYKKFIMDIKKAGHSHDHADDHTHNHDNSLVVATESELLIANQWYSVKLDTKKGAITQIYDKELQKDLVDEKATYKLGEFILEELGNRDQLQNTAKANGSRYGHLTDFERYPLDSVWVSTYEEGPIWSSIYLKGKTRTAYEGKDAFGFEIRLFNTTKRIDFVYQIKKKPILEPESFYIAFPFDIKNGEIHAEVAGGVMNAGVDQIPGSANDWNTVQNFVSVKNEEEQVVFVSHEAPIMQFGNINTGRFEYGATPESTHVYSWPMNNYWVTNFNPDQRGMYTWTYNFTSLAQADNVAATKFSWNSRLPFLGRVIPAGKPTTKKAAENTLLNGIPENILLINARPLENQNAIIFQFRETGNKATTFSPTSNVLKEVQWEEADVLGNAISESLQTLKMDALESKFFKLSW